MKKGVKGNPGKIYEREIKKSISRAERDISLGRVRPLADFASEFKRRVKKVYA
jgi:hypothetical protein